MAKTQVAEGLRSRSIPERRKDAPFGELDAAVVPASGKRVFASRFRNPVITLLHEPARQIGDQVIPERNVIVKFADYILELDPAIGSDAEKIRLLEKHEWWGNRVWDRDERLAVQRQERANELMAALMDAQADPAQAEALRQAAGKVGFDLPVKPVAESAPSGN